MLNLIIYCLLCYGVSNMFTQSIGPFYLFEKIREWAKYLPSNLGDAFECMICFPTWVGMILSGLNLWLFPELYFTPFYNFFQNTNYWYLIILCDGCLASGVVWLIHNLEEYFEYNKPNNNE